MTDNQFDNQNEFDEMVNFNFVIHIHLKKRSARKTQTIIVGIPDEFDLNKIIRFWKKQFNCTGGIISKDEDYGDQVTIRLTGDNRQQIAKFLVEEGIALQDNIKVHGI
ncbi:unnamed protein product [Paramecium primaurelia]|uniref:Chromosome undetermined scaffold_30, whole genome shotgun sequence n=4 Tax=Paramecium TaxID=5884 RepID=A0CXT2_PARTE|nr:uncharacterized protein GSPATT00011231001 [Paramecium tetraurelia]XP_001443228.1 uncharacterized protein GSPATT00011431001 [Paramecium tetraurelia]CAD8056969.1 unnamed protein product [Paramecium primaurelia]CAD8149488.1 unnamed protein product [Paramecium pentaurelia]CAD8152945.1 unnamed protein product [Paramecium octaurelia]CAD8155160.1 unnamed protein product [Paramecium octaurelia]CAK75599.1 unnamed protein product [Paramecium tetraurelia]|eukprot:XP_001442996.1 hypothetical protein (macronuclear) [Paramecium tetraurelia strain d4-2]